MKKILKAYIPMIIAILFLLFYGMAIGASFYANSSSNNSLNTIFGIGIIFIILFIIEWIYFIVHAARNKELKERVFWALIIYFLNIFVICYYNFKYVAKIKYVKLNTAIYAILAIITFIVGIIIPKNIIEPSKVVLYSDDKRIVVEALGYYEKRSVGQYDLYVSDYIRDINIGVFIYNKNDNMSVSRIIGDRSTWINTDRDNAKMIDSFSFTDNERVIENITYSASLKNSFYIYHISVVEFVETGDVVNTIIICNDDDYETYKDEFKEIVTNIKLVD